MASKEKKDNKKFDISVLNNKKLFLYVLLVGLLGFLAFYMLVYQKLEEKTNMLIAQNGSLRAHVQELKEVYDKIDAYKMSIDIMDGSIKEILSQYPADVKEDDALVVAVDMLNNAYLVFDNININSKEVVGEVSGEVVSKAGIEEYSEPITVQKRTVDYINSTDYINLKTLVDVILNYGGKKKIAYITYTKEENGEEKHLTGTIEVVDFVAEGTGAEYVSPMTKEYEAGLYDLFGIVKNPDRQ